ncbi:MAG: pantetheine-phosphate adenylyltransferase [Peptostreptococcaceae bacterium]|jgi:pantetheine-phosphate adenylyltransferase|nr:pantetheine-phosphate adenylyltransferase [Peptostreptococcaceae bacterium]
MTNIAIYPGSFDPITNGHLDIIRRASKLCDKLIVAVLVNSSKKNLFTFDERIHMIEDAISDLDNVCVKTFSGLLVDYCTQNNVSAIIRGLRAVSDFEYELQMAQMNRKLEDNVETIFLTASTKYSFLSSSIVKEIARYKGNIEELVPKKACEYLVEKF